MTHLCNGTVWVYSSNNFDNPTETVLGCMFDIFYFQRSFVFVLTRVGRRNWPKSTYRQSHLLYHLSRSYTFRRRSAAFQFTVPRQIISDGLLFYSQK